MYRYFRGVLIGLGILVGVNAIIRIPTVIYFSIAVLLFSVLIQAGKKLKDD